MLGSLLIAWGFLIFCRVGQSVSDEERKEAWNSPSPRGAKSSSSTSSSSTSSSSKSSSSTSSEKSNSSEKPSSPSKSSSEFSYNDLSANFDKQLKESNENFTKSLPKVDEKNFLKEMEEATKSLGTLRNSNGNSVEASLLSQYTDAVISTIQQTTQIQLALIAQQRKENLNQEYQKALQLAQQERAERMRGLSPMAINLGAAEITNHGARSQTSPLSIRTQGRHGTNSITSRAYKSPE